MDNKKILLDVAIKNLYDSLHQGEFGGVAFDDIPPEEKEVWRRSASEWIKNFLAASYDMASRDLLGRLQEFILKNEFPIDDITQLMVVRSELIYRELEKLKK